MHAHGITVSVSALSIPPRGEIKKDRVEIMSEDLVNAMEDAKYFSRVTGSNLNVIGWYHSHPHITVWPSNVGKYNNIASKEIYLFIFFLSLKIDTFIFQRCILVIVNSLCHKLVMHGNNILCHSILHQRHIKYYYRLSNEILFKR